MTSPTIRLPASTLWIMLMTLASTAMTLALACATPFSALAALAATQMRRRDGAALMLATWASGQAIGFGVLGYPGDPVTIAWGAALGMAAGAAFVAARAVAERVGAHRRWRMVAALFAAALAFRAGVLIASLGLGGVSIALSPTVAGRDLATNALCLIGLYALHRGITALTARYRRPVRVDRSIAHG